MKSVLLKEQLESKTYKYIIECGENVKIWGNKIKLIREI